MGDNLKLNKRRTSKQKQRLELAGLTSSSDPAEVQEVYDKDTLDYPESDGLTTVCSEGDIEITCKSAEGHCVGDATCSGSKKPLEFFEAIEEGWLMLGHGVGKDMVLVEEGPLVRRAQRWVCCWSNQYSGCKNDCAVYIPECDDSDFFACGVVFVFGTGCWSWNEPRQDMPVGLIHRSMVKPASLVSNLWSDDCTGSIHSIALGASPHMGTAWPSSASFLGARLPLAHEIKPSFTRKIPYLTSFLSLFTQRTFLDICLDSDDKIKKRQPRSQSWSPCQRNKREQREEQTISSDEVAQALPPGTQAPLPTPPPGSPRNLPMSHNELEESTSCREGSGCNMESFLQQVFMKLVIISEPTIPSLGTKELPSIGSAAHYRGACKPCAFAGDGCRNSTNCAFCHLCMPKQKKRGRWNLKRRRKVSELDTDFAILGNHANQEGELETQVSGNGASSSAD